MAESEDLNTIFNSFIQPYQERIDKLKAEQAEKDNEISNLKNTIYEMSKTVNQLKKEAPCSMNNSKSPSMAKSTLLSKKDEEEKKSFKAPGKKIVEDKKKLDKFQTPKSDSSNKTEENGEQKKDTKKPGKIDKSSPNATAKTKKETKEQIQNASKKQKELEQDDDEETL